MRAVLKLIDAQRGHAALRALWPQLKPWLLSGHVLELEIRPERRSTEQNARMWAMLAEVSRQVDWYGRKLTPEDWKCVFTAAMKRQDVVPGLDGGFVAVGSYTSKMTKTEMGELMDLIEAFGAQQGVKFKTTEEMEWPLST